MSKFNKKFTFSAKGILYIEDKNIFVEHDESGELINIADLLGDFHGKECSLSVAYAEDCE